MKKILYAIIILLMCMVSPYLVAQGETKNWYFANGMGLDFSTSPPGLLVNGSLTSSLGCASISGSAGNLLFYTDGGTVWDQTHAIMANGTGLAGTPGAQNCVILKKPLSNTLYYIFTVAGSGGPAGFCYSIVDISLAAGNGSVTVKNATVFAGSCEEKISATSHCNQTDMWVTTRAMNTNEFKSALLTSAGVATVVSSNVPIFYPSPTTSYTHTGFSPNGSLKFSHNGRRLAGIYSIVTPTVPFTSGGCTQIIFETFDFDNNSGIVNNCQWLSAFTCNLSNCFAYGTEWSPDGTKLYFTYHGHLMQVNYCVSPPNINGSIVEYGEPVSSNQWRATLQSGPDGKIYVANPGANSIGVIQNPNNSGNNCNYQPAAIGLGTMVCGRGLPNFYTPYFEKTTQGFNTFSVPGPDCRTYGFSVTPNCIIFSNSTIPFSGYSNGSYNWNFGDPSSGAQNVSSQASPIHHFTSPGSYTVTLLLTYFCGRTDTIKNTVTVIGSPSITITTPSLSCGNTSATVTTFGALGNVTYTWFPTNITGTVANNLSPAIHTVQIHDSGTGCLMTGTIQTASVTIGNFVTTTSLCSYQNSGTATVTAFAGSGNYTYSWNSSVATGSVLSNLPPGNYSVTVIDVTNNCTVTTPFQIYQYPSLSLGLSNSVLGTLCTGNTGTLTGIITGGTAPYSFLWTLGSATNTISTNNNTQYQYYQSGVYQYSLMVTDLNNCVASSSYAVVYDTTPTLTVQDQTVCSGTSTTLSASGALSYTWFPGQISGQNVVVYPQINTSYVVIGQNAPCSSADTMDITVLPSPSLLVTSNSPICENSTLTINGAGANLYLWTGPSGFNSTLQNNIISQALTAASGTYTLAGTAANGCISTKTIAVQVNANPVIVAGSNSPLCVGQILNLNVSPGYKYTWLGPSFSSALQTPTLVNVSVMNSGIYQVTATSTAACTSSAFVSVVVNPNPVPVITGPSIICINENATLTATGGTSFTWNGTFNSPSLTINPSANSVYSLTVISAAGCTAHATHIISVAECTGINEHLNENGIILYPNPVSSVVRIKNTENLKIEVSNIAGQILSSHLLSPGVNEVGCSHLANGVYYFKIMRSSGRTMMIKVIKTSD